MDWSRFELVEEPGVSNAGIDWSAFELVALGPGDGMQATSMVDAAPAVRAQDGRRVDDPRRTDAPTRVSMPLDALSTSRGTAVPAHNAPVEKGMLERVGDELGQLRDEIFAGVTGFSANLQAMNASAAAHQLLERQETLAKLVGEGRGDSAQAQGLRTAIAHASQRLGGMAADTAEAGALADAASRMTTRPQVRAVTEAKSFGESWEAFKKDPYAVVAGVTAQSAPQLVPMLIASAAMGPAAGAAVAGGASALTEFGSGIREFARDNGVDPSDKEGLGRLFADPKMLREAMAHAGKGGAIVGAMDAVSGGLASKTLVPKVFKNQAVRQAINAPLQAGVQAALGGAGEAGKQLAQKGEIDQPGQVLAEMVGELGGIHNPLRDTSARAAEGGGRRADDPPAPRVPARTTASAAPVGPPGTAARNLDADGLRTVDSHSAEGGTHALPDRDPDVSEALTVPYAGAGAVTQPAEAMGGQQTLATAADMHASGPQGGTALDSPADVSLAPLVGAMRLTDEGTLSVEGDPRALEAFLNKAGVDKVFLFDRSLLVAPEQAAQAQQTLSLSLPGRNGMGASPTAPVVKQIIALDSGMLVVRGDPDAIEAELLAGGASGAKRFAEGMMVPAHEATLAMGLLALPDFAQATSLESLQPTAAYAALDREDPSGKPASAGDVPRQRKSPAVSVPFLAGNSNPQLRNADGQFVNLFTDQPDPRKLKRGELRQGSDGRWKIYGAGEPMTAKGNYSYVIQGGQIFVGLAGGQEKQGHIDIARGQPVEYAGKIKFSSGKNSKGKLVRWTNSSGHYRPEPIKSDWAQEFKLPFDKFEDRHDDY